MEYEKQKDNKVYEKTLSCGALILFVTIGTILFGMEARVRTKHEKTLSDIDIKIRDHFFADDKIEYYVDRGSFYTGELIDADAFINSFSHVICASHNIVSAHDTSCGISCAIKSGKDVIIANADIKSIIIGKNGYKIDGSIASPVCSLAYAPEHCIAAGHYDGSLTLINIHERKMKKANSLTIPQCHIAPITSILCNPSQNICLLGGGNRLSLIKQPQLPYLDGNQAQKIAGDRIILLHGKNKEDEPILADLVALVGPFIVIQTHDKKLLTTSIYSTDAFNAIQHGTFPEGHKTFLSRMIDAQKNRWPLVFSDEETKILDTLCPSIKKVLYGGWKD